MTLLTRTMKLSGTDKFPQIPSFLSILQKLSMDGYNSALVHRHVLSLFIVCCRIHLLLTENREERQPRITTYFLDPKTFDRRPGHSIE